MRCCQLLQMCGKLICTDELQFPNKTLPFTAIKNCQEMTHDLPEEQLKK